MTDARETKDKDLMNAIDYIKTSNIFTNPKFNWITLLITKTLEDELLEIDINRVVDSLSSEEKESKEDATSTREILQSTATIENNDTRDIIHKIISIDNILNIGLLDIQDPIVLKDGLNVFYGKNGAGKSTIYLGLCKVLGKNKKIYSNIGTDNDDSSCVISVEDGNGASHQIAWNSNSDNDESRVMIFDNLISSCIVKDDQENKFEMAHLKTEYFSFLYDLYQNTENKLNLALNSLNSKHDALNEILLEKAPSVFDNEFCWDKEAIEAISFVKEDEDKLAGYDLQIRNLKTNNPEAVLRNLRNALDDTDHILSVFAKPATKQGEENETDPELELRFDKAYFEGINEELEEYIAIKKAFEESGKNKISSLIPPDWIKRGTWEKFISSSIDFLNSLEAAESMKYIDNICVYCHQPLQSKEAKTLVKAYQELHEEHRDKIKQKSKDLNDYVNVFENCVIEISSIPDKNKKIETEFEAINKKGAIECDYNHLQSVFNEYKKSIKGVKIINIDGADMLPIQGIWDIYSDLSGSFRRAISKLSNDVSDKESKLKKLKESIIPLQNDKSLNENKTSILRYLRISKLENLLKEKKASIATLRQSTSILKSSFFEESSLKGFKECLKVEYRNFNFSPPDTWSIVPSTREGINKRVYSIGDRRLAEIFSEGEKKLHALSDFFAHCVLNNYKGVFIFDDPVNSFDQDNIEAVARRITKLVNDGNQVIVFTHNLYFLNSIVNTQKDKITKVERVQNQINLLKEINIGEKQELKNRLKIIDSKMSRFAEMQQNDIDEYDMRSIYDLMSGYLEDYVEKVYFRNVISRYRPNIRMHTLEELKSLDTSVIDDVMILYDRTSRRGSRHSQPLESKKAQYSELVDDVEYLKDHFKYS